jgi:hypothetical protein
MPVLTATLTCPHCGDAREQTMPEDSCVIKTTCLACGVQLRPKPGDCCVFCSYGNVPCPPIQLERANTRETP